MAQTTRTVNDLIFAAFYLIGEFAENEPIEGIDFERGFDLLNLLIDFHLLLKNPYKYHNKLVEIPQKLHLFPWPRN